MSFRETGDSRGRVWTDKERGYRVTVSPSLTMRAILVECEDFLLHTGRVVVPSKIARQVAAFIVELADEIEAGE